MSERLISIVVPCRNGGASAIALLEALSALPPLPGIRLEAVVVDDASTDDTPAVLASRAPAWAHVVHPPAHLGRSGARNLGAARSTGELLLFLDCDCLPGGPGFLSTHLAAIDAGADASVGDIRGRQDGFWGRYQTETGVRRARRAREGNAHALTAANLLVTRQAFGRAGRFDERYRHYGFEDRDFLLRLERAGARLQRSPGAEATHAALLDLAGICTKMVECGRNTAALFRHDHPAAYRELGYAAFDARLHPMRAALLSPLARFIVARSDRIDRTLLQGNWPHWFQRIVARAATALAFLEGTRQATVANGKAAG